MGNYFSFPTFSKIRISMKKIILTIIIISLALHLVAQVGCHSTGGVVPLQSVEDSLALDQNKIKEVHTDNADPEITLFSQIDFHNSKNVSILYESNHKDSAKVCLLDDLELIRQISEAYTNVEVISSACPDHTAAMSLSIIQDYTTAHHYSYNPSCELLTTECGSISFDPKPITDKCIGVTVHKKSEYFSSMELLSSRIVELVQNDELLFFGNKNNFVTGTLILVFHDKENLVTQIEQDSFYRKTAIEQYSKNENLDTTGKIIQKVLDQDRSVNITISNWEKGESPNSYLLTVDYTEEDFPKRFPSSQIVSKSETYVLDYILKNRL